MAETSLEEDFNKCSEVFTCETVRAEDSRNQNNNSRGEPSQMLSTRLRTPSSRLKTASTKSEKARTRSEKASTRSEKASTRSEKARTRSEKAALFSRQFAHEVASNLTEKTSIKSKNKQQVRVVKETKACFQSSSDSSKYKCISHSDSNKRENKTGYSTVLENLHLSESVRDENVERRKADDRNNRNKILSSLKHEISKNMFSSYADLTSSLDEEALAIYQPIAYDLFVRAGTLEYSPNNSNGTESYSAINPLADERDSGAAQNDIPSSENDSLSMNIKSESKWEAKNNNLPFAIRAGSPTTASFAAKDLDLSSESNNGQLTVTTSAKSNSSEAAVKRNVSNANKAKPKQRETKPRITKLY